MTIALIREFDWQTVWPDGIEGKNVIDIACGTGHNGDWFAKRGANVHFIDRDLSLLPEHYHHTSQCLDLETGTTPILHRTQFDLVMVVNYLHRPLVPWLASLVVPNGLLLYETFTLKQATIGRPRDPNFLLAPNELANEFANWHRLHYFEGRVATSTIQTPAFKAQLIAQRPPSSCDKV